MSCHTWKCVPIAISDVVDISKVPGFHLLQQLSFQWGSQKLFQGLFFSLTDSLPFWFWPFLNSINYGHIIKGCKPDNFKPCNSLKRSLQRLEVFVWVLLNVNLFLNEISWHSCSLWEKLGSFNWFWQFFCKRLSSFNLKGFFYSYTWSCSLCERKTSFCTGLIYRKLQILSYVFKWLYFTQYVNSFSSINHLLHFYAVFFSISSNIDEGVSIKSLLMFLSLETLASIIRAG